MKPRLANGTRLRIPGAPPIADNRRMLTLTEVAAILAAGLFAGAAVYINLVEHPARMSLDTRHAARQWAPSYARATLMQAPLAVVGFFLGVCAWWQDHGTAWLAASLLIGAVV